MTTNLEICEQTAFDCVVKIVGDEWILKIIQQLLKGSQRFNQLQNKVKASPNTLSSKLKLLEEKKLIQRISHHEIPPRVEYNLTPTGEEMSKLIDAIQSFANANFSHCGQRP